MKKYWGVVFCLIGSMWMVAVGGGVPAPPVAGDVFEGWQGVSSREGVAKSVVPMRGSLPAQWIERGYVRLPVNFEGTKHERVSWDVRLELDLRRSRGVEFDFYCSDLRLFTGFSLYFRSGKGWYHATFFPESEGRWQRIAVDKADTSADGAVEGFEKIDLVRISGWRAKDMNGECGIANFALSGIDPVAVVIRAESNMVAGNPERRAYGDYAGRVSATLDKINVASIQVADIDITPEIFNGVKLAVLPYNPRLPDEVVGHLRSFVKGGGKLLVFYSLPDAVGEIIGLQGAGSVVVQPDTFSGFARAGGGMPGQLEFTPQRSWRATLVKPREGVDGRVMATWRDSKGQDSEMPAVTLTPDGGFVGHVWLAGSGSAGGAMMRSMVFELVPVTLRSAARSALDGVGRFDGDESYRELCKGLRGVARTKGQREAVAGAEALLVEAEQHFESGAWLECIVACDRAESAALSAWHKTRRAKQGEHRAFWCHSAFGLADKGWDESIRVLKESGFNVILPNMSWGGAAYYESGVLPVESSVKERGDQIVKCLEACEKYGVACHVWKVNWNMSNRAPESFVRRMVSEERVQRRYNGEVKEEWLCPSHPANQDLEVAAMVEVARKYRVSGIHFDYIRYPDGASCFCSGCRSRFEAHLGESVANWPQDTRDSERVREAWLEFRRKNIDIVVERVDREARAVRPDIEISAAVFSRWASDRDSVGQDWKMWCERGWLDFICPMNYTDSNYSFQSMVAMQKELNGRVRLYPGIGLSCWRRVNDSVKLTRQIEIVREQGLAGYTVFNFDTRAEEALPYLRLGTTAE